MAHAHRKEQKLSVCGHIISESESANLTLTRDWERGRSLH